MLHVRDMLAGTCCTCVQKTCSLWFGCQLEVCSVGCHFTAWLVHGVSAAAQLDSGGDVLLCVAVAVQAATLGNWFSGLLQRQDQLARWLTMGRPRAYWLTGFFNPQVS
jgi:hypothetical protein